MHVAYETVGPGKERKKLGRFRSDGMQVGALYGFVKLLARHLNTPYATHAAVIFDHRGKNFRHRLNENYKANRTGVPEDFWAQMPLAKTACRIFGAHAIEKADFEADDVIATYARCFDGRVTIVSRDADLMCLVDDRVQMFDPFVKPDGRMYDPPAVKDKWGVWPDQMVDFKALMGDSGDNVDGVPNIGKKTAAKLLDDFGTLDSLLNNLNELPLGEARTMLEIHGSMALSAHDLVSLYPHVTGLPFWWDLKLAPPNPEAVADFLRDLEFEDLNVMVMRKEVYA